MDSLPRISSCMKRNVVTTRPETTIREVAALLIEKRVDTLPVVDEKGRLVGLITIMDVVQIFFPDFVSLLPNIDFVKDFGTRKNPSTGSLEMAEILLVRDIMEKPVAVEEDSGLLMALSVMYKHNLSDIPVLKAGKLVGIASRMDIGQVFLMDWQKSQDINSKECLPTLHSGDGILSVQ